MKKLILLTYILPVIASAQTLSNYKATNGRYYHVGENLRLAKGTMPNGDFKTIQASAPPNGSWNNSVDNHANLPARYANTNVTIKAILPVNKDSKSVYFVIGGWNMLSYNLYIDDAIGVCEVEECNK